MMKLSKSSHKLQKNSRGSPPDRKVLKKHLHSSSSMRVPSSSRPPMKHLSPEMKRGLMPPSSKNVHSSRIHSMASVSQRAAPRSTMHSSPVAMDRMSSSLKRLKYEKRKMSPSPVRRPAASIPIESPGPPPFLGERYMSARPPDHSACYSPPPIRKKLRRSPEPFDRQNSPDMVHRPDVPLRQDTRMAHGGNISSHHSTLLNQHHGQMTSIHDVRSDHFEMHTRNRGSSPSQLPSSHSKRPVPPLPMIVKPTYQDPRTERYRSPSPRYPPQIPEKHYSLSLNERFSSVVETTRTEPRIKYTREDLEKITIDIHRNLKAESPILRRIVDPSDVKLVRRENEGHRPIFEREEIKKASRDMRDDAHYEKQTAAVYGSAHATNFREGENYEITRHRFDPHHAAVLVSNKRSLSDRWQNPDGRKEGVVLDRDDREREYERQQPKRSFPTEVRRSKSRDQDFRLEKYTAPEPSRSRPTYSEPLHRMVSPTTSRSTPMHHKELPHMDARRKLSNKGSGDREASNGGRPEMRRTYATPPEKHYSDNMPPRVEKRMERRSPGMEPLKYKARRSHSREGRPPPFSRRPDTYKSDLPPRSSGRYEHPSDGFNSYRGRGGSRPFRSSRGFRARGFRGLPRGGIYSRSPRGGYRSSSSMRSRGAPRRGRYSPRMWEHDMYSDRKMGSP